MEGIQFAVNLTKTREIKYNRMRSKFKRNSDEDGTQIIVREKPHLHRLIRCHSYQTFYT